ncbi:ABC transporter permease [Thiohalophilus sp.]|uniref:ABC transporter permease n=1 Tax=Thiohalophilus sp. TaxID=3028392 RepID=UPI003975D9B9
MNAVVPEVKKGSAGNYVFGPQMYYLLNCTMCGVGNFIVGLGALFAIWWATVYVITLNPDYSHYANFGLIPAFQAMPDLWMRGTIPDALVNSMYRLGMGLMYAIAIGVPVGIMIGRILWAKKLSNVPFQFVRMISPLSWEPIAVVAFTTWNDAIIFLVTIAAVWPIVYSTAAGLEKVDPNWFKVARNLGANPWHILKTIIMPAIAFDVLTGIRLALGVAWIVIVPAEFLGVTSGFGYAIQDAREGMTYDNLMAMILVIGAVGYILDSICVILIKKFSWVKDAKD